MDESEFQRRLIVEQATELFERFKALMFDHGKELSKRRIKFYGGSRGVNIGIYMHMLKHYKATTNASDWDIMSNIHVTLRGEALDWYWSAFSNSPDLTLK